MPKEESPFPSYCPNFQNRTFLIENRIDFIYITLSNSFTGLTVPRVVLFILLLSPPVHKPHGDDLQPELWNEPLPHGASQYRFKMVHIKSSRFDVNHFESVL